MSPPGARAPLRYVVYAVGCYAAFLATVAYAVPFVGNHWSLFGLEGGWFRSLDGEGNASLAEAIAIDLALVALFGVQHSVMARRSFKEGWARFVPPAIERSTYVLASSACLVLLFAEWRPIGSRLWDLSKSPLGFVVAGVALVGWLIAVVATFHIDHAELFGLRQVLKPRNDRQDTPPALETPGLYRAVRHPLYFGFLVAFWAAPVMSTGHFLFAFGLTVYVLIAIPLEERDLTALFGEQYRRYRARVRALLPFPRSGD